MEHSESSLDGIKKKLMDELSRKSSDISEILSLSTELSKLEKDTVRFTVDADHVSRLGLELVSKKETALSEIIKNAYDADADTVLVNFIHEGESSRLEIVDNGIGMSREELVNGFMRISTSMKKKEEYSQKYDRKRAGKKGIGRFAAQRLGLKLTVIAKREDDSRFQKIDIDWRQFESEKELIAISNKIAETDVDYFKNYGFNSGTLLIINDLRDSWTESQIKRAYRYTSELLLPFPISKVGEISAKKAIDPGFSVEIKTIMDGNPISIVDTNDMFLKHALAEIDGWIDNDGNGYWRVKSNHIKYDSGIKNYLTKTLTQYQEKEQNLIDGIAVKEVRNVKFKAYYFNQKGISHVPKLLSSAVYENLRNHGGVRLYRNGFRVLPYGEKFDDWLRLDLHTKTRTILPPVANQNFFGFVEITPNTHGYFEEVASREGLLETDAFNELREFVSSAILSAIVDFSYALGQTKVFAGEKDYVKKGKNTFKGAVEDLVESLEELENTPESVDDAKSLSGSLFEEDDKQHQGDTQGSRVVPNQLIEDIKRQTRYLIDKAEIYRILAGLGLSMAEFTHEVKFSILKVSNNLSKLQDTFSDKSIDADITQVLYAIDNLRSYTSFFEASFQSLTDKEGELLDLRKYVNEFLDTLKDTKHDDDQIRIETYLNGVDFVSPKAHRANFDSIIVNLYSNAKKAIYRAGVEGAILIELEENDSSVDMIFSDNGCGITNENKNKVFDEFFTTNTQVFSAPENQQMLGMGLGLTIVREIVEGLGGEIEIIEPRTGYSTSFHVSLPKADEKDVEDDF
ncbi:MAG: sensor histidine kinase [Bacterioplanes sp.]|nr:sensor histidine kinase [Bacterioplanes sp.]